jgi:hypothetical protein
MTSYDWMLRGHEWHRPDGVRIMRMSAEDDDPLWLATRPTPDLNGKSSLMLESQSVFVAMDEIDALWPLSLT